jgi:transmembrane sensor
MNRAQVIRAVAIWHCSHYIKINLFFFEKQLPFFVFLATYNYRRQKPDMKDKKWIHDFLDDQLSDNDFNMDLFDDKNHQEIPDDQKAKYEETFDAAAARKLIDSRLLPNTQSHVPVVSFGIRILKYAAAVILPLIIVTAIYLTTGNKVKDQEAFLNVKTASKKNMLILENGQQVNLDAQNSDKLNHKVIKGDNQLDYSNADNFGQTAAFNTLIVPKGSTYKLVLDDGTQIWVNADSRIKYQVNFNATPNREVYLEKGEAYFIVTKNPQKPFIVHKDELSVRVLGTSFNINSYADKVQTTLVEGKVNVGLAEPGKQLVLNAGEQANFEKISKNLEKKDVDVFPYVAWKDGLIVYQNMKMVDLMEELGRIYDYKIVFKNESLKQLHFTGRANRSTPIQHILDEIQITSNLKLMIKERSIIVEKSTKN